MSEVKKRSGASIVAEIGAEQGLEPALIMAGNIDGEHLTACEVATCRIRSELGWSHERIAKFLRRSPYWVQRILDKRKVKKPEPALLEDPEKERKKKAKKQVLDVSVGNFFSMAVPWEEQRAARVGYNFNKLVNAVCKRRMVDKSLVLQTARKCRYHEIVQARCEIAVELSRWGWALGRIRQRLGYTDHTSVLHLLQNADTLLKTQARPSDRAVYRSEENEWNRSKDD